MTDNMPRDTPARAPGCDYPGDFPPLYWMGVLGWQCRCTVCARCGHHTGNSHQGHHWKLCQVTGTMREFHFCCPGDCELESSTKRETR